MKTIIITEDQFKFLANNIFNEQFKKLSLIKEYNNLLLESTGDYWPGRSDDGTSDTLSDITDKTSKIQNKELEKKEKEVLKFDKVTIKSPEQNRFFQKWMYANMITTSLQDGFYLKPELIEKSLKLYKELMEKDIDKMFENDNSGAEKFKKTIPVIIKELEKKINKGPITSGPTYKEMGKYYYSPGFLKPETEERKKIDKQFENINENILFESKNDFQILQDNKIPLTPEERDEVMKSKAIWHHGPNGAPSPAIWKSKNKNGKITYVTHTHRAYNIATTLKGAINRFHKFIKGTA